MLLLLGATLVGNNNCINEKIRERRFFVLWIRICALFYKPPSRNRLFYENKLENIEGQIWSQCLSRRIIVLECFWYFQMKAYIMTCNLNQPRIVDPWRKFHQSYKKSVYILAQSNQSKYRSSEISILFVSLLRGGDWSNPMPKTGSD